MAAICSSVDGLKTGMIPEPRLTATGSTSMVLLTVHFLSSTSLDKGETRFGRCCPWWETLRGVQPREDPAAHRDRPIPEC